MSNSLRVSLLIGVAVLFAAVAPKAGNTLGVALVAAGCAMLAAYYAQG